MSDAFIGRQAIYDRSLNVHAYELLYRAAAEGGTSQVVDAEQASLKVMVNAFFDVGMEKLVGESLCFINLTSRFLTGDMPTPLPPERVVLEVFDEVEPSTDVLQGVLDLKSKGALFCLSSALLRPVNETFFKLADYVKVDIQAQGHEETTRLCEQLRAFDVRLIADGVESQEEQRWCNELGFEYFEGFFLTEPEVVQGFEIPGNHVNQLKLLTRILDPEVEMDELEELISQDASLTYKLLRFANSATYAPEQPISAIGQMIMMLGLKAVRRVVSLLILMELDDKPGDVLAHSLVRAKMCESIAEVTKASDPATFYTVGLLSTLDAITGAQMREVMSHLPLAGEIQTALLSHEGDQGLALECVRSFEAGDWGRAAYKTLGPCDLSLAYAQAVEYGREVWGAVPKGKNKAA